MSKQGEHGIAWTDETYNPIRGCSPVSPGCAHCWAARMANRHRGGAYKGFVEDGKWTGRVELIPDQLGKPLHWRKPRRIAVALMGDLFHARLTTEDIAAVFGVMAACPQHTFQVLTKRPERMREWFKWVLWWTGFPHEDKRVSHCLARHTFQQLGVAGSVVPLNWPLPNVHLYVSVEDQAAADERIPLLLQTPAAVRGISLEPMLGPVDLRDALHGYPQQVSSREYVSHDMAVDAGFPEMEGTLYYDAEWEQTMPPLSHVIVGGESGPGARPCNVEWVREVVCQCRGAGTPVFCKQWGSRPILADKALRLRHSKGGDPTEWGKGDWPREFPRG